MNEIDYSEGYYSVLTFDEDDNLLTAWKIHVDNMMVGSEQYATNALDTPGATKSEVYQGSHSVRPGDTEPLLVKEA